MEPQQHVQLNCPNCHAILESDAVLCIDCGFHLKLNKKLNTEAPSLAASDNPYEPIGNDSDRVTVADTLKTVRVFSVALLLNCLLFFDGCTGDYPRCSLGVAVPFAKVDVTNEVGLGILPSRLYDVSPVLLLINAALGLLIGIAVLKLPVQRRAWRSLFLAWGLTNSILFSKLLWLYVVGLPVTWIRCFLPLSHDSATLRRLAESAVEMGIPSRLWLTIMFGLFYGVPPVIAYVLRSWSRIKRA